jgi:HSP20 family molecular chaperone IbpA
VSAKWRRHKKTTKKFNLFNVFSKSKEKNVPRTFRVKTSNVKPGARKVKYKVEKIPEGKLKEPPRLIDVVEENDEIAVFAEFAGFDRENLRVSVKNQRLTLSARASERRYHKSLNLPKRVIPESLCTTYKNGVLEIRLKKVLEQQALDKIAG